MNRPTPTPASEDPLASRPEARARHQRFRIGSIEATALNDGFIPVPNPRGPELTLRPLACLMVRVPQTGKLVLMDAGFGPDAKRAGRPLPTAGRLLASLAEAGVAPGEIDAVLISHIHPDHVDGLYDDSGAKIFPNATYHAGAEEVAFWNQKDLDLSHSSVPPPFQSEMLECARRLCDFANDTLTLFQAGDEALPGIGTMLVPGHTPGQVAFVVPGGSETLLYTADAFTSPEMSINNPEAHNPVDLNPAQAVQTRLSLIRQLAQPGWHGFTPHFPWPNLGQLRTAVGRLAWQPEAGTP